MTGPHPARPGRRRAGLRAGSDPERGSAIVEFIGLSALLLLPIGYALMAALDVQRAAYGVSAAARAYGRAYQLGGPDMAAAAAGAAMADQGMALSDATVRTRCIGAGGACTGPGGVVEVTVTYADSLPLVPGWARDDLAIDVSGVHVAAYGRYRDAP